MRSVAPNHTATWKWGTPEHLEEPDREKKSCIFCHPFLQSIFQKGFPDTQLVPRKKSWKKCLPPPSAPLKQGKQWHPLNESAVNKTGNLRGIKRRTEGFI